MAFQDVFKFYTNNYRYVLIFSLILALAGIVFYYAIPPKFTATGSLYVSRKADVPVEIPAGAEPFFTYEGYYAQQSALSFTTTVIGLLESADIKAMLLNERGIGVDEASLRKTSKSIDVKKTAPQLISLTVKKDTPVEAQETWTALTNLVISTSSDLNKSGDASLTVQKVVQEPVVKQSYRNVSINALFGLVFGFSISSLLIALKEYAK